MKNKITVILARAGWCGHCKDFEPIFEESKKNYLNDNFLSKQDIEFIDYDLATNDGKNNFTINHIDALEMVGGYPTVLVNIANKKEKNSKYYTIEHTIVNPKINSSDEQTIDASSRFITNISNLLKSLESDNKILYMQTGGGSIDNNKTSLEEEIYRIKYLKYKSKYLKIKNKYIN